MDNNRRLKILAAAIRINDADIAQAATLGGIKTSRHRAQSWMRSQNAIREHQSKQERRFKPITEEEFDAVLLGLKGVLDEFESRDQSGSLSAPETPMEQRLTNIERSIEELEERMAQVEP